MRRRRNVNVGVLGHVDSGKTSLVAALSSVLSTASLDKHPASKCRGITLDLGFSASSLQLTNGEEVQLTFVDCPGHASLVKTVLGGATIMDIVLLVIDVSKGTQAQTIECVAVAEVFLTKGILVFNKRDLVGTDYYERVEREVRRDLEQSIFRNAPSVFVSAIHGDGHHNGGMDSLLELMKTLVEVPERNATGDFICMVDHCFARRGHGTIMTGTVISGRVSVGNFVQVPHLGDEGKDKLVKGIQVFHEQVDMAAEGDRAAFLIKGIRPDNIERTLIASHGTVRSFIRAVAKVERIQYFCSAISSMSKFHITIGHATVMGRCKFFKHWDAFRELEGAFDVEEKFMYMDDIDDTPCYVYFETPSRLYSPLQCRILGCRLDWNENEDKKQRRCRIAFHGTLLAVEQEPKLYRMKSKMGSVSRVTNAREVIGSDMFAKETNLSAYQGLKVVFENGQTGIIQANFGTKGRFKIHLVETSRTGLREGSVFQLRFKKRIHSKEKEIYQDDDCFVPLEAIDEFSKEEDAESHEGVLPEPVVDNLANVTDRMDIAGKRNEEDHDVRSGVVCSLKTDGKTAIIDGFFTQDENVHEYLDSKIVTDQGVAGNLMGAFGRLGKCKVCFKGSVRVGDHVLLNPNS